MIKFNELVEMNRYVIPALLAVSMCACSSQKSQNRDIGIVAGGAIGAGTGAVVGSQVGNAGEGAAIGAATGALVGGLIGHTHDIQDARFDEQETILAEQEEELARQTREIEDLRRQRLYNEALDAYQERKRSHEYNGVYGDPYDDGKTVEERY